MKKLMILITLLVTLIITGCTQTKDFQIEYDELSEEQAKLLTLTGNRVYKYNLKNPPNDKNYELKLVYEVYKNNKKIKEKDIIGMAYGPTNEEINNIILEINIQDNKIRCISGQNGEAYSSIDIDENIEELSHQFFTKTTKINLGDEIYLFHGLKGKNGLKISDLGLLSKEDKDRYIKENELNVFLKLICEKK
ncbi:hypothetical protein [Terrisporobacter sp.]|uniref:hypothetical protein n=1 Tax=Terrisporobacter sp. TaxID=1965305 RepID=UPI0026348F58|nr:hypothetical protein [Terrisporobacter sp.]